MSKACLPPEGYVSPHLLAGIAKDAPVAVALSGGADSVALLHILFTEGVTPLYALHVHHGIRGAEADRDEQFCRTLCETLGVPLEAVHIDVPALAADKGLGLETAARCARYAVFTDFLKSNKIPLLVTAHHADDQLETLLQNLLRGSGLRGLCGIPAYREMAYGAVARPLLQVQKSAILAYCRDNGLSFMQDSTNDEPCCPRNRLRAEVLPVLAELWHNGAASAARTASLLCEDEAYLQSLAAQFLREQGSTPAVAALAELPHPVFARVMQSLLPVPPEAVHIEALRELVQRARPHASLSLPAVRVLVENGRLVTNSEQGDEVQDYEIFLQEGENPLPGGMGTVFLGEYGREALLTSKNIYKHSTRISLSSAIINGRLRVRCRRAGDRILSGGKHKAVRKLPSMTAFTPRERARMPLLCDDAGIVAVPFGPVRDGGKQAPDITLQLFFQ